MDLNTRQHKRASLEITLHFQVHLNHRCQVDLVGSETNRVGRAREVSEGGLSFVSRTYLPRRTVVELDMEDFPGSSDGTRSTEPVTLTGRVVHCVMVGRQPRYQVAVSFSELNPKIRQRIRHHVTTAAAAGVEPVSAGRD